LRTSHRTPTCRLRSAIPFAHIERQVAHLRFLDVGRSVSHIRSHGVPGSQGRGQLRVNSVPVQIDLVVAGMRRFFRMTERRAEVLKIYVAADWQHGYVAQVPMPFIGVRKGIDHIVLVFVAGAAAELGDGAKLNHRVGYGRSGKDKASPHAACRLESYIRRIGQRSGSEKGIDVLHRLLLGFHAKGIGQNKRNQDQEFQCFPPFEMRSLESGINRNLPQFPSHLSLRMGDHEGPMQSKVQELRIVVTVNDYEEALHFHRDVLGLKEQAAVASEGGHVVILEAGKVTLELADSRHAEFIDEQEVGQRVAGHIRVAFRVDDSAEVTKTLELAGARVLA
jgi:lactoylglutathione lyase